MSLFVGFYTDPVNVPLPLSPSPSGTRYSGSPPWTTAETPPNREFDSLDDADLMVVTPDDERILCHKWPLTRASSFFQTMFELPQPAGSKILHRSRWIDECAVAEHSSIIIDLLRFIYPDCDAPVFANCEAGIQQVKDVMRAAHKYSMDSVRNRVVKEVLLGSLAESYPEDCYAMGDVYKFNSLEIKALPLLLQRDLTKNRRIKRLLRCGEFTGIGYYKLLRRQGGNRLFSSIAIKRMHLIKKKMGVKDIEGTVDSWGVAANYTDTDSDTYTEVTYSGRRRR